MSLASLLHRQLPRLIPSFAPWLFMMQRNAGGTSTEAGHTSGASHDNACKHSLLSVIEQQIIPRLLDAHTSVQLVPQAATSATQTPTEGEIQAFALSCLAAEPKTSQEWLEDLRNRGYSTERLFLQVIAPAARFLGLQWEQDKMDFSQVTLGLLRMHQLAHELGYAYRDGPQVAGARRRIMLASAPGSQHLLGLTIVSEFFRKERWQVVVEISVTQKELADAVANEWFDMLGLSVGLVEQLADLPSLIQTLRQQSRNPEVKVLLGGPAFLAQTVQAIDFGADGISLDASEAVVLASELLSRQSLN